jgi:hypothetical protein
MCANSYAVTQVLIGTHWVGIIGLRSCLRAVDDSGLDDREEIVDLMMKELGASNFIPDSQLEEYRIAVLREYLRHRGEDFSAHYSEIPVVIRGRSGNERDRLVWMISSVLAEHELRPSISFAPADGDGEPCLEIRGEEVVRGTATLNDLRKAVRHRLSDW